MPPGIAGNEKPAINDYIRKRREKQKMRYYEMLILSISIATSLYIFLVLMPEAYDEMKK